MVLIRWALIIATLFAGTASRASEASPWISQSSTSRFDGSPIEIASLPEDGEQDSARKALLVVRCRERKVNFYVSFRDATFVLERDQIWVRYDTAPPQIVKWIPSSDNQSVGIWSDKEATEAARKIVKHETLFIRVDGRRRSEALFKLSGVEAAVEKVLSVCRRN